MSQGARKKDPKFVDQVMQMIEGGMSGVEVVEAIRAQQERDKDDDIGSIVDDSSIPEGIQVIAQALAFREPTTSDAAEIHTVLSAAYSCELRGSESFRSGDYSVERETIMSLLVDKAYKWCVVEAPNGKGYIADGAIIGACCYSTDGVSRKNGFVEGNLGAIRYCGVLPQFHGLCIGFRLLFRVETAMLSTYNCCRSMVCLPSSRISLLKWIVRRGYDKAGEIPYPSSLGHTLKPSFAGAKLQMYVKSLHTSMESDSKGRSNLISLTGTGSRSHEDDNDDEVYDDRTGGTTDADSSSNKNHSNSNNNDNNDNNSSSSSSSSNSSSSSSDATDSSTVFENIPKVDRSLNMHLSPIWRQQSYQNVKPTGAIAVEPAELKPASTNIESPAIGHVTAPTPTATPTATSGGATTSSSSSSSSSSSVKSGGRAKKTFSTTEIESDLNPTASSSKDD